MNLKNYFNKIIFILGNKKKVFLILILLFFLLSFFETLSLALIAPYLTILLNNSDDSLNDSIIFNLLDKIHIHENIIFSFGIFIIIVFTCKLIVSVSNIFIVNTIGWKEIIRLRLKLLTSFSYMNYDQYIKKNSSEYINLIAVLSSLFVKQTFFPLIRMTSDAIILISIVVLLATLNIYILASVFIIFFTFLLTYDFFFKRKVKIYGFLINKENENIFKNINEMFYGFKEIKILNKLNFFMKHIIKSTKEVASKQVKIRLIADSPRYIYEYIVVIILIIFIFMYNFYSENNLIEIIPTISVFILAFLRLLPIISTFNQHLTHLRAAIVANDVIYEHLNNNFLEKNILETKKNIIFKSLEFKNISFSYEDSSKVLDKINFKVHSGEMIGLIGPSASGKSTFVDIFLGLLKPQSGKILLNDVELNFLYENSKIVSDISCYLPQENFIFDDNIIKNVSLSTSVNTENEKRIKMLLTKFDILINLNKKLGDRGTNLSGGQRQRVSIARSFYYNRQILIMDESTSALDEKIELEILEYLKSIKGEITVILISHKMNTLKYCDKIYKIEDKNLKLQI